MNIDRRDFLKKGTIAGLGFGLAGLRMPSVAKASANDTVVVATVGIRSRGRQLTDQFANIGNCKVKYVVDVDQRYLERAANVAEEAQGSRPEEIKDFRRALDDKDVDAIVIATPEHWHTPMAIMALKAGKHVYLEKPGAHNPAEGELLVAAQKKYGKLVQLGNQRRSSDITRQMMREIRDGLIGNVYMAKTWYANKRGPIGFGEVIPVPDYLDWELWQGPAPRTDYRSNVHPYNWHWFYRWGTGETLNNGTHEVDVARWALGVDFPTRVASFGGRWHHVGVDDWEFPDTQTVNIEYEEGKAIVWEGRSCNNRHIEGRGRGVRIYGTEGTIIYLTNSYEVYDQDNKSVKNVGRDDVEVDDTDTVDPGVADYHAPNFVNSVAGKSKLNSPIDEGYKSILPLLLSNIAQQTNTVVECNPQNGRIVNNLRAQRLWTREYKSGWEPTL